MSKKRDTILHGRDRDYRGTKTRFRRKRDQSGPVRQVQGSTPVVPFAEAEERALLALLNDKKDLTDQELLAFLVQNKDVDPVCRRLYRKWLHYEWNGTEWQRRQWRV